jgi:hypothetical protein
MNITGHTQMTRSRESGVGIATSHGLEEPLFELRCVNELFPFPYPSRAALGPTQPTLERIPDMFSGINMPERGVYDPLTLIGAEVKMSCFCTLPARRVTGRLLLYTRMTAPSLTPFT